ncbi:MAG: EAL domain-containing protein [Gammaproteobacteria bacterium]|nr:EAL domain-containing protein [Gammaproteobacteria bacterium]
MKLSSPTGNHRALQAIGFLLALYLAVLLGVVFVAQSQLQLALNGQARLATGERAAAIELLLTRRQVQVDELAQSSAVRQYMTGFGLGADTQARPPRLSAALANEFRNALQAMQPPLSRLLLVDEKGHTLLEVDVNGQVEQTAFRVHKVDRPGRVQVEHQPSGSLLRFSAAVMHEGEGVASMLADLSADAALRPLLAGPNPIALVSDKYRVVTSSGMAGPVSVLARDPDRIEVAIGEHDLRLLGTRQGDAMQVLLASPLFLAGLALVSVPLLFGVAHLLRLGSHNQVLQTRFENARQQRMELRRHNERLQREIDHRFESEKKLAHQANYDQLTGLPNRSLALDRLTQAVKWARREGGSVQVLFLDLDRFKQVNDSLGHAAGDELLREAAQRLRAQMRDSDTVSRLGGDEFLVICPESSGGGDWEQCARDLLKTLSQPFFIGDHEFFVGASIGVASFPEGGTEPLKLLKNADIAMYAAKEQGRNRYSYYDPSLDAAAVEAMRLEHNLRHALARDELRLEFQPIVNLSSGRTVAAEALLRWTSRELGEVPPDKFIPVAEETGLIHEIGEWVLKEACRQIGTLHAERDFRVAVNLSTRQFSRPRRLLDCMLHALRDSGLMPSQLELEITESVLIDDRPEIGEFIGQLDRIGVRLSIDDFGTGYSALNYLQRFPFDILKIDRSFTREIPDSEASSSLIRAIIAMAHALGLEVIAEGIEDRRQTGFLLVQHCELGQGFLYAKPMPLHALRELLRNELDHGADNGRVAANVLS